MMFCPFYVLALLREWIVPICERTLSLDFLERVDLGPVMTTPVVSEIKRFGLALLHVPVDAKALALAGTVAEVELNCSSYSYC
ncbi:MAG: hypothetical protein M3Z24_11290 [Chloroflexota bacterium]|nr:hypothetical protein [Chloroflexota bacterium]